MSGVPHLVETASRNDPCGGRARSPSGPCWPEDQIPGPLGERVLPLCALLLLCAVLSLPAAERQGDGRRGRVQPGQTSRCNDVPAHGFDIILARPTSNSVTLSILAYENLDGWIVYGSQKGVYAQQTPRRQFGKGEPTEVLVSGLQANTQYFYQFRSTRTNSSEFTFHTARLPGNTFTFTVTADSHLDEQTDPLIYQRTLANASAEAPDFHIDLGDTFMTEKYPNREEAARQYLAQRYYFGQLSHSAPLFLVLGNHDGESPRGRGTDTDGLAVWSNTMRKRYFPNPVPDGFYTGDAMRHPQAGLLQDYYAWEWGDALFLVLDPFWFAQRQRGQSDNWKRTLGGEQYEWLKRTLEGSRARLKFVFIHHLVGGADSQARGGAEVVPYYEWGGHNGDGSDGFKQNRPGWPAPIHQLLVQNRVSIVFHGHDHLYAKQDADGIVYQAVSQPGYAGNGKPPRSAADYGYASGTILGSSGHLRIRVSGETASVDYISSRSIGGQADSYVIQSK
jgi:hypothetical protein